MTIEPTAAPNEFKVVEWNATFLFATANKLTLEDAKIFIKQHIDKQFEVFVAQRIKNKHHTIV